MRDMTQAHPHTGSDTTKRYTVILDKAAQGRLSTIAKQFKISQGQVLEVLIDKADLKALTPELNARREAKTSTRTTKSALIEKLATLTPEQKAYLESLK
jgi:hypothetical protein